MAKLNINTGASDNDKSGDTLRNAFVKVNANFTELYTLTGGTAADLRELAQDYAAPLFNHASHTNITVTYDDANNKILLTGAAAQVQSNWTASSGLGVILNKPTLFSGSYTDLTSKPTIPTSFSSLVNGAYTASLDSGGKLTAPGNLQVDGGKIILHPYGNAYVESVDYGVNSSNSAVNIFGGPYQKIKLRAGLGTEAYWTFGTNGTLTFPNATVQSTAYVAPTTGNSVIDSINPLTISRNGMTIRVTSAGMIQMSFNSVITITGRSSINNADSVVISSPNGATTSGTWYNIGAVLAAGDHLTATIVDSSFHRIYRLTAIIREKGTTPGSEFATAYAIIEQLQ